MVKSAFFMAKMTIFDGKITLFCVPSCASSRSFFARFNAGGLTLDEALGGQDWPSKTGRGGCVVDAETQ